MRAWLRDVALPWTLLLPVLAAAILAVPLLWAVLRTRRALAGS